MSRYDQPTNEPDLDRYELRTDIEVPDFDDPAPDPAERELSSILADLSRLERQILQNDDLQRAHVLRKLAAEAWQHADDVAKAAAAQIDQILERRR